MLNELFAERYADLRLIGRGGFGAVYRARDTELDRDVALKLLNADIAADADWRQRFGHEARAASKLAHPNITVVFDRGEFKQQPFIAMELVEGETLSTLIERRAPLSDPERLLLLEQLCDGLHYAHQRQIVHRDIKPSNLIVREEAEGNKTVRTLKILDFGVAKVASSDQTASGTLLVTPNYVSPELIRGEMADARSDMFAVGAVAYELFAYRKAFLITSTNTFQLLDELRRKIVDEPHQSLLDLRPELDAEISSVVDRALAKRPADRFADVAELRRRFQRIRERLEGPTPDSIEPGGVSLRPSMVFREAEPNASDSAPRIEQTAPSGLASAPSTGAMPHTDAARLEPVGVDAELEDARTVFGEVDAEARPALTSSLPGPHESSRPSHQHFAEAPVPQPGPPPRPICPPADVAVHQAAVSAAATVVVDSGNRMVDSTSTPAQDGTVLLTSEPADQVEDGVVRLLVGRSPDAHRAGQTLVIPNAGVTLGRGDECDIVVRDPAWSRHQATIHYRNGSFEIIDQNSANGTFVNGRRVGDAPEPLFFGATVTIGETVMTFSHCRDTSLPNLCGVVVAQRYHLERLLRESAKAALYAARDRNVPRDVAIKLLSPDLAKYAGYREQFQREARTAAQLQHPHICQVLDSGLAKITSKGGRSFDTHFLCFELMAGGSLAARLRHEEPNALHDVHRWVEALGAALHYAHQQDVVHGDLKPSAIVFDATGNLYLTDFAIAQKALLEGRHTLGSPAFMAPEQWDGAAPTAAADQFGFAALVYLMLAGTRPFEGQDNPHIRQKNFRRGPVPVHVEAAQNGRGTVSRAASEVLGRALSRAPADRFASVEEFTRALLKALGTGRSAGAAPMVFISYDRELSGGWARFFADRLKLSHGIRIFMDTAGLDRAGRFPPRLRRAIEDCDVFVCFLAGRSLDSKWVREEIGIAHELRKTMVPIFQESYLEPDTLDDASPIGALIAHQGVKLFDVSGHFVEHAVTDLARLVTGAVSDDADVI